MWVIIKNKSKELNLAISELAKIDLNKYYIAKTKKRSLKLLFPRN